MSSAISIDPGASGAAARSLSALSLPRARTRWWAEALVIVWLGWVYDMISNLAPLRLQAATSHAWGVLHLEQALRLDPELTLDRWLAAHHTLGLVSSYYYDNAHFIVTLGLLGWLWWRRAELFRPLRNALVLVNVFGFIVFWLYPVAPPRLLGAAGFTDVVASTHTLGSWHTGALASQANQLAAMPSLHMAWAAWCTLALWQISRRKLVRVVALIYPCLTGLAVLATGNHFVLDIVAGLAVMAIAALIVWMASAFQQWQTKRADRARSPLAKSGRPAYRMSQSCYEVQDQVE